MPSSIASFEEFDRILQQARADIAGLHAEVPDDQPLHSVHLQLEALHNWTRDGRQPTQDEKDRLNFGLIASRNLDDLCPDVCSVLYKLASYVIYW